MARFIATIVLGCLLLVFAGEMAARPTGVRHVRGMADISAPAIQHHTLSVADLAEAADLLEPAATECIGVSTPTYSTHAAGTACPQHRFETPPPSTETAPVYIATRRILI